MFAITAVETVSSANPLCRQQIYSILLRTDLSAISWRFELLQINPLCRQQISSMRFRTDKYTASLQHAGDFAADKSVASPESLQQISVMWFELKRRVMARYVVSRG
jgi:hypothetical protein